MAGDWIKVEKVTPEKPEVEAMADQLKIDPDAVFGKLFRIWSWFDDHTEKGDAPSVTRALLDRMSGVTGFGDAMVDVGWLVESDHGLVIPNFDRHNGKTAKNRALSAKRNAELRRKRDAKRDAPSVTSASPREEKRREETSPPNPPPDSGGDAAQSEPWRLVEEEIRKEGVAKAADAVVAARSNGCTPEFVQSVVEVFRSNKPAWSAGALYTRLMNLRSWQDPEADWPPPSEEFERARKKRLRDAEASKQIENRVDVAGERAAASKTAEELERDFGPELDSLRKEKVREMIREIDQHPDLMLKRLPARGKTSGVLRESLLMHLQSLAKRADPILEPSL